MVAEVMTYNVVAVRKEAEFKEIVVRDGTEEPWSGHSSRRRV
jgi:hypothetical protein